LYQQGKRIKKMQLFTNGNTFTLMDNYYLSSQVFSTSYSSSGEKHLKFILTYEDNSTKITYATLDVSVPSTVHKKSISDPLVVDGTIDADDRLEYQGYGETSRLRGRLDYRIYYDTQNEDTVLDKPLIILDGYDPGDERKIDEDDFPVGTPKEEIKTIFDIMSYIDPNIDEKKPISLVDKYRDLGFDVIVVNNPVYDNGATQTIKLPIGEFEIPILTDGGTDYIQRNAYTFISLLRRFKAQMEGKEKFVIVGPSMGGLISRYALATMEKKLTETGDATLWDHNTRLWVSFDSPHQGANIPIGVQKGIQHFASSFNNEAAKEFIRLLDRPAPSEMLVNHYTNDTDYPVGKSGYRDRFQAELDALGYPQNLRKVALINGSISGSLNGISKAKYLDMTARLPFISTDFLESDFYHATNNKTGLEKELTYYGRMNVKLWCVFGSCATVTWGRHKSYSKPYSKGSYDIAPGGYTDAQNQLLNGAEGSSWWSIFKGSWNVRLINKLSIRGNLYDPTHSFIPTKSALAFVGNEVLDENISHENLVCAGKTPFDAYYAPEENQQHIFLTPKNVAWLDKELKGNNVFIDNSDLSVGGTMCKGETRTFTFENCTYTGMPIWDVSNNLEIITSDNSSITVKALASVGEADIKVTLDDIVIQKSVHLGKPNAGYIFIKSEENAYRKYHYITFELSSPSSGAEWFYFAPPGCRFTELSDNQLRAELPINFEGFIEIGARVSNKCGVSTTFYDEPITKLGGSKFQL
jgi:hypothetical protein